MAPSAAKESSEQACRDLVQDIQKLVKDLPKSVPVAEKDGKISRKCLILLFDLSTECSYPLPHRSNTS